MDKPLFPTGLIVDLNGLDIEKMCYYSEQWGIDRKQLEKGMFSGDINAVHTPHIQLATTTHSLASTVEGDFPTGSVLLFFVENDTPNIFQNSQMRTLELIYAKESKEIDLITNSKSKILTFVVEETLFNQTFYDYFARPAEELLKDQRLFIEPEKLSFFLSGLYAWIDYLKSEEHRLALVKDYDKIELEMITHVFECLVFENRSKERVKFNVSSARDLLHESIETNTNIGQLAQELKISEDHLLHAFRSNYGLSPKKYLQNLRLNAIRKELLLVDSESVKISDIAYKYGFSHMSHFASEYKKMFGELPSTTMSKR